MKVCEYIKKKINYTDIHIVLVVTPSSKQFASKQSALSLEKMNIQTCQFTWRVISAQTGDSQEDDFSIVFTQFFWIYFK